MPIGVIAIDSIFSPVTRVKYSVGQTRVGQMTDFDKLDLDIWTDGRIEPADALLQASSIMRHHLDVFVNYDDDAVEFENAAPEQSEENAALKKLLNMSVNEIELSVRAANCDPSLLSGPMPSVVAPRLSAEEEAPVGLADLIAQNLNDE